MTIILEKIYKNLNVYEALQKRFKFIFSEFDNIYVSFSGGKDSGVLLNCLLKYKDEHGITLPIGVFHQDYEAQFQHTTDYVIKTFDKLSARKDIHLYYMCLPFAAKTSLSNYDLWWYPWDENKKDLWIREQPKRDYVISIDNNIFDWYTLNMQEEDIFNKFTKWYGKQYNGGKTLCLLGLRANESLRRYNAIVNKKYAYKGVKWISANLKDCYSASPLYDWTTEDIWTANAKFGFEYNHLYDLYYKAGVPLSEMRVASAFNKYAAASLNLYRVIEPNTWAKLVGRVSGANFGAIYGKTKAMGYKNITLPSGYTWKSYTKFLLSTLPPSTRQMYLEKFKTSENFWHEKGGGLSEESIQEIEDRGYKIRRNGVSNYTKNKKTRIVFNQEIPDDTDDVISTMDIPSWKRMCYCILKNDHLCRFMGFGPNKEQQKRIKALKDKYSLIIKGGN